MAFVFSFWYFVMIALVAGVAACLVIFFRMDKQDKVMIEKFISEAQNNQNAEEPKEEKAE